MLLQARCVDGLWCGWRRCSDGQTLHFPRGDENHGSSSKGGCFLRHHATLWLQYRTTLCLQGRNGLPLCAQHPALYS